MARGINAKARRRKDATNRSADSPVRAPDKTPGCRMNAAFRPTWNAAFMRQNLLRNNNPPEAK